VTVRAARAAVLARRGTRGEAEALAREAVAVADRATDLWVRGDVRLNRAEVLSQGGRVDDARSAAAAALGSYDAKEQLVVQPTRLRSPH